MNSKLKTFLPPLLLLIAIFGATMILFLELRPFILFNTDDWQYISIQRTFAPAPGSWNPTRVFPEIFMPLCANIASYVLMPFVGDYIESLTIECALIYSTFIVVYVGLFYALVRKRFNASVATAFFATALFYLFHFVVMRKEADLFQTDSITNLFYYALPNFLCCSVVLFLMKDDVLDGFFSRRNVVKKGIFLAVLYVALISNVFASIAIAAYIGIDLLLRFIKALREKKSLGSFFAQSIPKLIVLAFWAIIQFLEATGGRAHSLESASLSDAVVAALSSFAKVDFSSRFAGLALIVIVAFLVMAVRHRVEVRSDSRVRLIGVSVLAGVLTFVYLVLLCASSVSWYMSRADVLATLFFFIIAVVVLCLVMLMNRYPRVTFVVPVVILFVVFSIHPAVENVQSGLTSDERAAVTNEIIDQVKAGVDAGEETVEVHVPAFSTGDNWPIADYAAWSFSRSLYQHGVIDRMVGIKMIPDPAMNEKYGIPVSQEKSE